MLYTQYLQVFTRIDPQISIKEHLKIDLLNFDNADTRWRAVKLVNLTRTHLCRKMPFNNQKLRIKFH